MGEQESEELAESAGATEDGSAALITGRWREWVEHAQRRRPRAANPRVFRGKEGKNREQRGFNTAVDSLTTGQRGGISEMFSRHELSCAHAQNQKKEEKR